MDVGASMSLDRQQYRRMQAIEKVTLFRNLESKELQRLLALCTFQSYDPLHRLYTVGEPSENMFILLRGIIIITLESGEGPLGEIRPGMSIGEMGVFTGHPRSANATTMVESTGLQILKSDLEALFMEDKRIHNIILQNVVSILSERVLKGNIHIENYAQTTHRLQPTQEKK